MGAKLKQETDDERLQPTVVRYQARDTMAIGYLNLIDTPDTYTGQSGLYQRVTSAEDGLEHFDLVQAISALFSFGAYGSMIVDTPVPVPDLGAAWQTLDVFDEIVPAVPRGVTLDLPSSTFTIDYEGVYWYSLNGTFEHNSSNQGRITYVRPFNVTDGAAIGAPLVVATGRNAEATPVNVAGIVEVTPANANDQIRWEIGNGDSYSSVIWNTLSFSIHNVGEWREGPLADPGA